MREESICPLCGKEIQKGPRVLLSLDTAEEYFHEECATKKLKEIYQPLFVNLSMENPLLERLKK